jgi:hypothetical protein
MSRSLNLGPTIGGARKWDPFNRVDVSDHIRDLCSTLRRCYKIWCSLWHYLLDTSLCNAALI